MLHYQSTCTTDRNSPESAERSERDSGSLIEHHQELAQIYFKVTNKFLYLYIFLFAYRNCSHLYFHNFKDILKKIGTQCGTTFSTTKKLVEPC